MRTDEICSGKKQIIRYAIKSWLFAVLLVTLCLRGPAGNAVFAQDGEMAENEAARTDHHGTCYEVFVYSFFDSDGDGIGDLNGLQQKLDYIQDGDPLDDTDLGCDMIWLMPVFPSPTYHKYDVTDYMDIDPAYGSLDTFDTLLLSCHERGLSVILDLPLNHTSVDHPWFREAAAYLQSLGETEEIDETSCPCADYYNFSREQKAGYEPLPDSNWFYEARFWSGMPDLNLDSEAVREEIAQITAFWLGRGVDGFRLDAVTYYYSEDKAQSIAFLSWLKQTVEEQKSGCYLVGEAWTDQDTYASYYESGIDSLFDFAFAGQEGYIAALARGKRDASWYGTKLMEEEKLFASYGSGVINAPFYTNHDMARGAGYYTRDDGSRVKLAQALNLLMSGNAFLYYGEELGMKGSGRDENKRAPMYWSDDPTSEGMCQGPPEMEEIKHKYGSLAQQEADPYSIYAYVRKAIHLRADYPAIAKGKTDMITRLSGEDTCVLLKEAEGEETVLICINTGDEPALIHLDGSAKSKAFTGLAATLCVSDQEAELDNMQLTLPSFGIAVLRKGE